MTVHARHVRRLAALLAVLPLAGCGIWGVEGGPGGSGIAPPPSPSEAPATAQAGPDGVQRIEVRVGDDLRFHPALVQARPGVIEFVFVNAGATAHDIRVEPALDGTGNLNEGQRATVRVEVSAPGRYPFPCLYHVSSGMEGTLEVL